MKLLLVNQYFWPDRAATAQLLADLAEDAAAAGHEVAALACNSGYALPDNKRVSSRELWRQVSIRRVWSTNLGRQTSLRRLTDYATFLAGATVQVLFGARADVVVCLSTPPMVALLGVLAKLRGSKFVYKVEDLYPDIAVALGTLEERSVVTTLLRRLSRFLLRSAEVCVALDGAMAGVLEDRGARKVAVIPNWADGKAIRPDEEAGRRFRKEEELGEQGRNLAVLYSGNLGLAHRFDAVTEVVDRLAEEERAIEFLFVGAGGRLAEVQLAILGLPNVRFLPYQPRERLNDLYNAADLHLVTLRDEVAGLLVPSKYAASLAAGKAVLLIGGGNTDMHREVANREIGWICGHAPDAVYAALTEAAGDPDRVAEMGKRARGLFEEKYRRVSATKEWLELLSDHVG